MKCHFYTLVQIKQTYDVWHFPVVFSLNAELYIVSYLPHRHESSIDRGKCGTISLSLRHLKTMLDNTHIWPRRVGTQVIVKLVSKRKSWWKTLSALRNNVLFNFTSQHPLSLQVRSPGVSLFRKSWHFQGGRPHSFSFFHLLTLIMCCFFSETHPNT